MPDPIFRLAPIAVETTNEELKKEKLPAPISDKTLPKEDAGDIMKFEETNRRPFLVDNLNLQPIWAAIVKDKQDKPFREINAFILKEIETSGMRPTATSYREILNRLETEISIKKGESVYNKIDKLKIYIRALDNRRHMNSLKKKLDIYLNKNE